MSILTKFLKLVKPEKNDYVDVEKHISENYDKIDNKIEELSSSNDEKLNKGNVSSEYDTAKKIEDKIKTAQGTADNKLNKGSLPATITDAKEIYDLLENNSGLNFDKNLLFLNDKGVKTQGKIYFDRNKVGMFECIKTTPEDYVANSTTYFVDISNKSSSDRLSNLVRFVYYTYGDFGNYKEIPYPTGFTSQNSYVIITDIDFSNLGTCSYSISNDRIKFKGVRINNSLNHNNDLIFTFLKVSN